MKKRFLCECAFEDVFGSPYTKVSPFAAVAPASPLPSGVFAGGGRVPLHPL